MNYSAQPIWNQQQQHATFKVTPITFPPKFNAWFELEQVVLTTPTYLCTFVWHEPS